MRGQPSVFHGTCAKTSGSYKFSQLKGVKMIKAIAVILGLSPLLACVPMVDDMAAETMMDDSAAMHGDAPMDDDDTMSSQY